MRGDELSGSPSHLNFRSSRRAAVTGHRLTCLTDCRPAACARVGIFARRRLTNACASARVARAPPTCGVRATVCYRSTAFAIVCSCMFDVPS
jgi:hypothetical protein